MGSAPSHKSRKARVPEWAIEQSNFVRKNKYPHCRGIFPDCPETIISDVVADVCKICPIYRQK